MQAGGSSPISTALFGISADAGNSFSFIPDPRSARQKQCDQLGYSVDFLERMSHGRFD
jgi:hypothetical protein